MNPKTYFFPPQKSAQNGTSFRFSLLCHPRLDLSFKSVHLLLLIRSQLRVVKLGHIAEGILRRIVGAGTSDWVR